VYLRTCLVRLTIAYVVVIHPSYKYNIHSEQSNQKQQLEEEEEEEEENNNHVEN
jgi:hypothetical protein